VDIKSLILIGGGLLLAAVIGHGFWLAWRNKRSNVRLDLDPNIPQEDVDPLELLRGELPNGGARVRSAQERQAAEDAARAEADDEALAAARDLQQEALFPDHDDGDSKAPSLELRTDDRIGPGRRPNRPTQTPVRRGRPQTAPAARSRAPSAPEDTDVDVEGGHEEAAARLPDEVIVINVLGRGSERFAGNELLEVFLRHKLKFGDMNIFHRLEPVTRTPQFSVASAVEPGTFDLSNMDSFSTRGVSLFMQLPGPKEPLAVFDDMLSVARDLAGSLGGDLKDEQLSIMTAQSIEHCRQRITDFTRKRLSQRG
jgi:cell division protein ZipA